MKSYTFYLHICANIFDDDYTSRLITTVGYGSAVPLTRDGRSLCYSFGFVCILMFTVLISIAGELNFLHCVYWMNVYQAYHNESI